MNLIEDIMNRSIHLNRSIVLPEGYEERTIRAAAKIVRNKIAHVILLGEEKEIREKAKDLEVELADTEIVNHLTDEKLEEYTNAFYDMRVAKMKKKGIVFSKEDALKTIKNPLFFGAMMVREGFVDGMVAGADNATSSVLRAALQVIGTASGVKTVSSCFIMIAPQFNGIKDAPFAFGDCAVVPFPTYEQLADIAISTAKTFKRLVGETPEVAMLSYSTKGSAKSEEINKVTEACELVRQRDPELLIDGELQADAALIPSVAKKKAPNSPVAGDANVVIFPDLNSGNIGYKLTQRFGNVTALGPIIQGLKMPVNDLSRGCSVDDIVRVTAITSVLAEERDTSGIERRKRIRRCEDSESLA